MGHRKGLVCELMRYTLAGIARCRGALARGRRRIEVKPNALIMQQIELVECGKPGRELVCWPTWLGGI